VIKCSKNAGLKKEKQMAKKTKKLVSKKAPSYPRYSIEKALRIPRAILEQNAGKECTDQESAKYVGVKYNKGPYHMELVSAIKFGLLERPSSGRVALSAIARNILKPQDSGDDIKNMQKAVLQAPIISDIYTHFRGENLPDEMFFDNALSDKFKIPTDKLKEFKSIFYESLISAKLILERDGKKRIIDVSAESSGKEKSEETFKKLEKTAKIKSGETCFVMMPFLNPLGSYYEKIYKLAIEKAGLIGCTPHITY
jgi:hypothetical protein